MIHELKSPIPMTCEKGSGYAHFMIDRGMEHEFEWVLFLENNEIWSILNSKVRLESNYTYGRIKIKQDEKSKSYQQIKREQNEEKTIT